MGLRVNMNDIEAPIRDKAPEMANALSKLPVALTMYPVTIGASKPNEFPPRTTIPKTVPVVLGSSIRSFVKA